MVHAEITAELPSGTWGGDVSSSHSEAVFRILATVVVGDSALGLVELAAPNTVPVIGGLEDHATIVDLEIVTREGDRTLARYETDSYPLVRSSREANVPIRPPIVVQSGDATFEVYACRDHLSTMIDRLRASGCTTTIETLHDDGEFEAIDETEQFLSDRQWEVVSTAIEAGYYETPRECTLTELADRLGIAKSTCSEVLRHAERTIVRRFVEKFTAVGSASETKGLPSTVREDHGAPVLSDEAGYRSSEDEQPGNDVCNPERMLDILANENAQALLRRADEPKTVLQLAQECSIPETTTYRLTEKLCEAGLLEAVTEKNPGGDPPAEYQRSIDEVLLQFRDDQTVEYV